ncbi:MAG TPA: cytochrome D1 domain-containing protein, partial [Acetobacteraceae bacterium]|nr:cytochrome D1 domain-containing protein [Acetobacteraceae bacterium]
MQTDLKLAAVLAAAMMAPLPFAPAASAYTAYTSNERDNTISVIDLDQMKTVKTIPVGQRPRGITVTPDGKYILLCASDDDEIQFIDTKTLQIV